MNNDELNQAIIDVLKRDGRCCFQSLRASVHNVPYGVFYRRLQKLSKCGAINKTDGRLNSLYSLPDGYGL